jgi:hypothetical protein
MSLKNHQPANYDEAKRQFEEALAKAKKLPGNQETITKQPTYIIKDGIPHKFKEGRWVPLTRIN